MTITDTPDWVRQVYTTTLPPAAGAGQGPVLMANEVTAITSAMGTWDLSTIRDTRDHHIYTVNLRVMLSGFTPGSGPDTLLTISLQDSVSTRSLATVTLLYAGDASPYNILNGTELVAFQNGFPLAIPTSVSSRLRFSWNWYIGQVAAIRMFAYCNYAYD